jgi:phosphatidylglycerol---prolipoprotein diacylglyceryl transferase
MYALALTLGTAIPFFRLGELDVGIPIQAFGVIVAIGVLIGAGVLRRYGEWHGVSDDHIRGITGWVTVTGFIGAHVFDVLAYQWDDFVKDPILIIQLWKGISSYGGFLGGAMGFFFYVWWKRLPPRLMADTTILGLLVAFSIGRIACTVVSDHVGAAVDPDAWYAALAMDYPRHLNISHLSEHYPGTSQYIRAWNLGFLELLYLIPVNVFILWYAFRSSKRPNAGMTTVLVGVLYAPVRFFIDFLRLSETDPRYFGLTFAQWASMLAFGGAIALAIKIAQGGKPAETIAKSSGDAQRELKRIMTEAGDSKAKKGGDKPSAAKAAKDDRPASAKDDKPVSAKDVKDAEGKGADKKDPRLAVTKPEDE